MFLGVFYPGPQTLCDLWICTRQIGECLNYDLPTPEAQWRSAKIAHIVCPWAQSPRGSLIFVIAFMSAAALPETALDWLHFHMYKFETLIMTSPRGFENQ